MKLKKNDKVETWTTNDKIHFLENHAEKLKR